MAILSDPVSAVSGVIESIINKFPDGNIRAQALATFATQKESDEFGAQVAQLKINLADAQGNWFQSSWRPALAWNCVAAFAYHFLVFPFGGKSFPNLIDIDPSSFSIMMGVLTILIGARTYDKSQGTDTK